MPILLLLALLGVIAVIAVVAAGRGEPLPEPEPDRAPYGLLPEGPITGDDIDRLHFSLGLRGYRMDEVDAVLDRLRGELAERDQRIASLEGRLQADGDG